MAVGGYFAYSFIVSLISVAILSKKLKLTIKDLQKMALVLLLATILTIADITVSIVFFGAVVGIMAFIGLKHYLEAKNRKSHNITFLALLLFILLFIIGPTATTVYAQDTGPEADIIVTYVNSDGFTIQAKDGQQVIGNLMVTVYVSEPAVVTLTATVGTEKIAEYTESVDFKASWPINVPESKYNYILTVTVQVQKGPITKTYVKSFTVVKRPIPPKTDISQYLAPSQVIELIKEAKWNTILYAIVFVIMGLVSAIIMKYKMMILEPLNIFQIIFIGVFSAVALTIDPDYGAGFIILFVISDILTYRFLEGPERIEVLEFDTAKRIVWQYELPIYVTKAGKLAVALQDTREAIKRLLGKHMFLRYTDDNIVFWKLNNEYNLILAEKTEVKEREITEEEPEEMEASETLFSIRKKVKHKERQFIVKPFDSHKFDFLRDYRTLEKVLKDAREGWKRVKELEKTLELEKIKAEANALRELINLLNPEKENVEGGR